jgi:hypothetical protein
MALQVFVVVGGVTRVIPLTGLTTPFLAYGGSSMIANWIAIAVLMRISDLARASATEAPLRDAPHPAEATRNATTRASAIAVGAVPVPDGGADPVPVLVPVPEAEQEVAR